MARFRIDDCTAARAPGRLMRRIDRLMRGLVEVRLMAVGLNYAQWATLKMVREGAVTTAGEVARELGYTSGAATRLIDTLERRGCVARVRGGDDRRVARLVVTPDGVALVERGMAPVLDLWNEAVADFDQDEANLFVDTLCKLLVAVEAKAAGREPAEAEAVA